MRPVILYFVLAVYLGLHACEGNIQFSLTGATSKTYKQFIQQLRQELSVGTTKVYNITVLKHEARPNQRFILVDLINYNRDTITLGIDVLDVYVVGYLTGNNSYFFKEAPDVALSYLFPSSKHTKLTYGGSYTDLERGAGALREDIYLGLSPLDTAITSLFRYEAISAPKSFLVIIQMVSEAARFKYIEQRVRDNIGKQFKPDPAVLSLENKWGALSTQIQEAQTRGGQFPRPVELRTASGKRIQVTDVTSDVVKGVALLLYHKIGSITVSERYYHDEIFHPAKVLKIV